jgi:putative transposase
MIYNLDRGSHSVYSLHYHFVQCIKYRRKVLCNPVLIDFLKTKIHNISKTYEVEVLNIECDKDHFHLLFTSQPTLDIPKYINTIKTITSREIRKEFPEVKEMLWEDAFWSRSYFIATTGQVTLDILKRYVESQNATSEENTNLSN